MAKRKYAPNITPKVETKAEAKVERHIVRYTVLEKYIRCVVTDTHGIHVLMGATQKTLKHLYETGHGDKIQKG